MRSGVLFDDYRNFYGADSPDVLVWKASSTYMNPSLRDSKLEAQRRVDPSRFAREYLAEFAEDLESFLPSAWVEQAIIPNVHELAPEKGKRYSAGVDASGGGADAFTLSVCHYDHDICVQDVCRGWKKTRTQSVDLEGVVNEIAGILKRYGLKECHGDRYAANWVVESFRRAGITYKQNESDKSVFYLEAEPLFATGKIQLLDHQELARELRMLERRPRPGGKTVVDHPRNSHDDYSNSLAIAAAFAKKATITQGFPIGVGRGIGVEIASAFGRTFGRFNGDSSR